MNWRSPLQTKTTQNSSLQSGLLQRKCAQCDEKDKLLQRQAVNQTEVTEIPAIVHEVLRSSQIHTSTPPQGGDDFSNVKVHADGSVSRLAQTSNGLSDDPIHQPLIEQFRRQEGLPLSGVDEFGQPVGPSDAEIKYTGLALSCPLRTEVESSTDMTSSGLASGYLSGYGSLVKMRVHPDARTWNGTQITESLTNTSSNCPTGLTQPGPCTGNSVFTVGAASGRSALLPVQPGLRNRFYDFHTSRSRTISFLHDSTRNPTGMDSCQTVCEQQYSCNGSVIGRHTITRTFRKGVHDGRNVTIINVTKT